MSQDAIKVLLCNKYCVFWVGTKPFVDTNVLKTFRPVSNLCLVSKLMEKVVRDQRLRHLNQNNLWRTIQSAHRPKHTTSWDSPPSCPVTSSLLQILNSQHRHRRHATFAGHSPMPVAYHPSHAQATVIKRQAFWRRWKWPVTNHLTLYLTSPVSRT